MNQTTEITRPQPTLSQVLHAFHSDEDGLEALQVVMICGIAAVILLLFVTLIPQVRDWVVKNVKGLIGMKDDTTKDSAQ